MSAAQPVGALAPGGPVVRPWHHHLGAFDLAQRVRLHPGVDRTGGALSPHRPARALTADEQALLDGRAPGAAGRPALEVFSTPALLGEHFWSLDPDELPGGAEGAQTSEAWQGFAQDVRGFLDHVRAPVARSSAMLLTVRDPAAPPALFSAGPGRALLERDAGGAVAEAPGFAIHLNLGAGDSSLIVWSVPLVGMAALLAREGVGSSPPPDALTLVQRFALRFPACPLLRLTLLPGEGVLVPLVGLAHDFDAAGATDLDVTLSVVPGAGAATDAPPAGRGSAR